MKKLKLFFAACALMFGASAGWASVDITDDYLKNADLSVVNSGWDYYSDAFKYTDWKTDGDVPVVEFYSQWNAGAPVSITQKDFKFSQTVTMPAGYYRLAVNAFYRNGGGDGTNDDKAWIFVKGSGIDKSQNVVALTSEGVSKYSGSNDLYKAANAFSKGDFSNAFDFELTEETEVEIGFQGFFNLSLSWCILGPVKLYEYTAADYIDDYRTKVAEAEALYDSPMYTDDLDALKDAVVEEKDLKTVEDVMSAIGTLSAAINKANNSITEYASDKAGFDALKAKANNLADVSYEEIISGSHSTFTTAISTQSEAATNAANATAMETAISTLKEAMVTYVGAANPKGDGAKFDCTFMLTNPDLTGLPTWAPAAGWASEETDGNSQVMVNDSKTVGDKSYFYEYWSNPAKASGKFALYNAVTLPAGTFAMSCYAFAENQYAANTVDGVYFYANNTQGSCVTATVLTEQTLSFVNKTEQEVKIGLKTVEGNTRNWMGIGYVELYKVPAQVYEISENADYDNTQEGAGTVTLTRNIKVGYNTLVLPFSMTQAEVEANFGDGSVVYDLNSIEGDVWHFVTYDGISANRPCILKATVAGTSYNLEDRMIIAGTPEHNVIGGGMTGSYAASLTVPEGNYIINGDKLYKVNSAVTIKGTRAYFNTTMNSEARTATLSFDGEILTGISAVESGEFKKAFTGDIFDLTGRKVKNPSNGIYVVEGKKVVF